MSRSASSERRGEAGVTVIELSVVVALVGIVSALLMGFLVTATRVTDRAQRDTRADQAGQLALRHVTQDLRGANSFSACGANYVTCVTMTIPRPTTSGVTCPAREVTYQLVGTNLLETRKVYASTCGTPTTRYSGRRVIGNVVNGSVPLLTYYSPTGAVIDPVASPAAVATARSVKVTLVLRYKASAPTLTMSSFASLRNKR